MDGRKDDGDSEGGWRVLEGGSFREWGWGVDECMGGWMNGWR